MYISVGEKVIKLILYNIIKYILISQIFYTTELLANNYSKNNPEASSEKQNISKSSSKNYMIVTADYRATKAAEKILILGGNALDAAIAAQNVLSVIEPQSSGLGGGGFLLFYDNIKKKLQAWDGREKAPISATANMFIINYNKKMDFIDAVNNKSSIGIPGLYSMLADAHAENGNLEWYKLFKEAINYAEGFTMSPRLNKLLTWAPHLKNNDFAQSTYFYNNKPIQVGTIIKNLKLKESLKSLSKNSYSINTGAIAKKISKKLNGYISKKDLKNWKTIKRKALCKDIIQYKICGFPPPTSGGISTIQILGILANKIKYLDKKNSVTASHLFMEASRLAYLDRAAYIADPAYFKVPTSTLISNSYLEKRSSLINSKKHSSNFKKGKLLNFNDSKINSGENYEQKSTTHISIVDKYGNAVALTSSIEFAFGSGISVGGFFLNNQLTDFSFFNKDLEGKIIANAVYPGKKPRSSMAPTLIFEKNKLLGVIGSPGGSRIICYVAKTIYEILYLKTDPAEAITKPHICSRNQYSEIEEHPHANELIQKLKSMGHNIKIKKMTSGLNIIWKDGDNWLGIADNRREGYSFGN
ncbi:gamma-glutamyltransferase family protein [Alphaproteobacteria bacterium]|nr:gamma-glutamyltransferase family protein [Alphaproteobacteria bacterium]